MKQIDFTNKSLMEKVDELVEHVKRNNPRMSLRTLRLMIDEIFVPLYTHAKLINSFARGDITFLRTPEDELIFVSRGPEAMKESGIKDSFELHPNDDSLKTFLDQLNNEISKKKSIPVDDIDINREEDKELIDLGNEILKDSFNQEGPTENND